MTPDQAQKLDAIAVEAADWFDVSQLRTQKDVFDLDELQALNAAFAYGFRIAPRVRTAGDTFLPLFVRDSRPWPPAPQDAPDEWRATWAAAFRSVHGTMCSRAPR